MTKFKEIRADLPSNEELKIIFRDAHELAYSLFWVLLLKQGRIVKALFAADGGRA